MHVIVQSGTYKMRFCTLQLGAHLCCGAAPSYSDNPFDGIARDDILCSSCSSNFGPSMMPRVTDLYRAQGHFWVVRFTRWRHFDFRWLESYTSTIIRLTCCFQM